MTLGDSSSGRYGGRTWRRFLVPLIAVASAVIGILVVRAPRQDVGWFAYAPLANDTSSSNNLVFMDGTARLGYALILAGMLLLAFWAGYRFAPRRTRRQR
jgi:heme/copper-type cytochrome/quinol oxidase subunit 1